jgi:two-component system, LytTR family, sensor kinase
MRQRQMPLPAIEPQAPSVSARVVRPLVIIGIWSVPAMTSVAQEYLYSKFAGHPMTLGHAFLAEAPAWYVWALLTPVIFRLVERRPLTWPPSLRTLWPHVALLVVGTLAHSAVYVTVNRALQPPTRTWLRAFVQSTLGWFSVTTLAYAGVAGVALWIVASRRAREREVQAAALAAELARAQLGALRAQLHPHFLFNTLNTISVLGLLAQLSDILRQVLRQDAAQEVPFRDEIAFLRQYLGIEQVRFQDRLTVSWMIDDRALGVRVPSLILQPLVENALKHGIASRPEAGCITIGATVDDGRVRLWVADDGAGLNGTVGGGVGLANTRARLAQHYGSRATLELTADTDPATRRTVALIELPRS